MEKEKKSDPLNSLSRKKERERKGYSALRPLHGRLFLLLLVGGGKKEDLSLNHNLLRTEIKDGKKKKKKNRLSRKKNSERALRNRGGEKEKGTFASVSRGKKKKNRLSSMTGKGTESRGKKKGTFLLAEKRKIHFCAEGGVEGRYGGEGRESTTKRIMRKEKGKGREGKIDQLHRLAPQCMCGEGYREGKRDSAMVPVDRRTKGKGRKKDAPGTFFHHGTRALGRERGGGERGATVRGEKEGSSANKLLREETLKKKKREGSPNLSSQRRGGKISSSFRDRACWWR